MNTASPKSFQIHVSEKNNIATLHLGAWFGFQSHKQFTSAYSQLLNETILKSIAVDLSKIEHLDTSALGMLLLLRQRAMAAGKSVLLVGPSDYTDSVFKLTDFDSLFEISRLQ
jgi:anti-anti-sigma factor